MSIFQWALHMLMAWRSGPVYTQNWQFQKDDVWI